MIVYSESDSLLPLFQVHFQIEKGGPWYLVEVDAREEDHVPANFLHAYKGVYPPLSECFDFRIERIGEGRLNSTAGKFRAMARWFNRIYGGQRVKTYKVFGYLIGLFWVRRG